MTTGQIMVMCAECLGEGRRFDGSHACSRHCTTCNGTGKVPKVTAPSRSRGGHSHCLHPYQGIFHMVLPDGHILLKCCKCDHTETQHRDHWAPHGGSR